VVSSTPRPHFTPGNDPVPILQEAGCAPGPVWTGGKSRPHWDTIPDRPARSQSLYRLSYPAQIVSIVSCNKSLHVLAKKAKVRRSLTYVTEGVIKLSFHSPVKSVNLASLCHNIRLPNFVRLSVIFGTR